MKILDSAGIFGYSGTGSGKNDDTKSTPKGTSKTKSTMKEKQTSESLLPAVDEIVVDLDGV